MRSGPNKVATPRAWRARIAMTNARVREWERRDWRRSVTRISRASRNRRALLTAFPPVEIGDAGDIVSSVGVLELHDLALRPMEVIGDKGYLLAELVEGVA